MHFCCLITFFKHNFLKKNSFRKAIRVLNSLDPDQDRCSVCPDLYPNLLLRLSANDMGPNCLQRLSADDMSHEMQDSIFPITSCISLYCCFICIIVLQVVSPVQLTQPGILEGLL